MLGDDLKINIWDGEDKMYNLQLEQWEINPSEVDVLRNDAVIREFNAWIEEWEAEAIRKRNDPVAEAKLLRKYGGLIFDDLDNDERRMTILSDNCEWKARKGWHVIAVSDDYFKLSDQEKSSETATLYMEPWEINKNLIDMIVETAQLIGLKKITNHKLPGNEQENTGNKNSQRNKRTRRN